MIRFIFRILGFWLFAGAFVALVLDGARSITSGDLIITPMGSTWFALHSDSLNLAQAVIQRNVHPYVWDPVMISILAAPTWLVIGVISLLFIAIGKKRRGVVEG
ncbi:MAG: hypothetical protein NXI17_14390 [Alphaproteobacteria bacterium]|nr:hypothetical protein [Alphaproteobacteria bacterium]